MTDTPVLFPRALNRALLERQMLLRRQKLSAALVNPAMANSDRSLRLLKYVPRDLVLSETDGPFVKVAHGPARPEDTREVISTLAKQWSLTEQDTRKQLYDNFLRLLTSEARRSCSSPFIWTDSEL